MKNHFALFIFALLSFTEFALGQSTGSVRGIVRDKNTQEIIENATVFLNDTLKKNRTNEKGEYVFEARTGSYTIKVSAASYATIVKFNIVLTSGNSQEINFELEPNAGKDMGSVTISADKGKSAVATDMITPLSVQALTAEEIKANPGGNFDVSKVIQTLPGGGSQGGAQRNDVIIRGGAPNENVYYLDGIEIPVLNHFQTQGSSGGAAGILNVNFIEEVKLSSSAFDARYDNALASTFVIKQRNGNPDKLFGNARVSFTETSVSFGGPINKTKEKTTFLVSGRVSYLDFLFKLIDLPIRPNFQDYQYKVTHKINEKTTLTMLGVGAIDRFSFAQTKVETPENAFFRRSLPLIQQWTYTVGFNLKRKVKNGFANFIVSRNMFDNNVERYEDGDATTKAKRNLFVQSQEIENKFRFEMNKYISGWKFSYGISTQYVKYNTDLFTRLSSAVFDTNGLIVKPAIEITSKSAIEFFKYGGFAQVAKNFFNEKLLISVGIRTDLNNFLNDGNNIKKGGAPRISFAYELTKKLSLTASVGSYTKIPTYTNLGFRNKQGELVNKNLSYIRSGHYVLGTQFLPNNALRFTVEGFYKNYSNYPVTIENGISTANQGSEFGAVGNEAVTSIGKGRTYGAEFFVQQKLIKKLFYVVSLSYVRSEYTGATGAFTPSSWDNQFLVSATMGYKFRKNWELGLKYRLQGGNPYTPWNETASQSAYPTIGTGVLDLSQLNTKRLPIFSQLDFRLDKKINFKNTTLDFYIDITNLSMSKQTSPSNFALKRKADNSDFETTDGQALKKDGSNGIAVLLPNVSTNVTPTIGFIFEF